MHYAVKEISFWIQSEVPDDQKVVCCEDVKTMMKDRGFACPPIQYIEPSRYLYNDRRIAFCPCCGKLLAENILSTTVYNNSEYCCSLMQYDLENANDEEKFDVFYQPFCRRYFFSVSMGWREVDTSGKPFPEWDFKYCIYCGTKEPDSLLNLWLSIAKNEFLVEPTPFVEDMLKLVPCAFRTEKWWKSRNL